MNYTTAMVQLPLVKEARKEKVMTPQDVSQLCTDIKNLAQETFQILVLNTKNFLLNRHIVTLGLVNSSLVHAREVFRPAILDGGSAVILVHNHPSGDATPSAEDIRITTRLMEAGKIVDIRLMDHIIIGRNGNSGGEDKGFFSMRENRICNFK